LLDSGPLGLISNPRAKGPAAKAQAWARARLDAGDRLCVPEIADYEVRRELLRADRALGVERLDVLCDALGYEPLTTAIMRDAAALWADARKSGRPTAADHALDGDVVLAAQARSVASTADRPVVIATTNPAHLRRYADARVWHRIV
jgi:predicted nucleic acid-binding protein